MTDAAFTAKDRAAVVKRYSERLQAFGHSPLSVGWGPKDRQVSRFAVLGGHWNLEGQRVLDIGAGFGDLFAYLAPRGIAKYLGVELVPGLVETGRERYAADRRFELIEGEFLEQSLSDDFDIAFVSGMFNFKLEKGMNYQFIADVLSKAFSICAVGVAANFITDRTDFREDLIFYANEGTILAHCFSLTRRVVLRADYFPFEFSVFLHKDDAFKPETAVFSAYEGEL